MRRYNRLISFFTAAILVLLQLFVPAFSVIETALAKEADDNDYLVEISSLEEFLEFAENCRNQEYSRKRQFELLCDIDLSEYKNLTVPYIDGIFDGKNHSITGISIEEDISDCGLFRFVGENGIIKNLKVEAVIVSDEEQQHIGIIAGSNSGMISDCTSLGSVNAQSRVGGIAGINEKGAIISDCVNEASIDGKYRAGGITGENEGVVSDCINQGAVNTNSRVKKKPVIGDGDSVNISIPNAVTGLAADERANETGGIAGMSEGSILYCTNKAAVGCKQLGSCTGGIVGRMKGYGAENENYGIVSGRQSVGGIVGYLDPYSVKSLDRDYYEEFKTQIDGLIDIADDLRESAKKTGDDFNDDSKGISDSARNMRNTIRDYIDGIDGDLDSSRANISSEADELRDAIDDMDVKLHIKKIKKCHDKLIDDISDIAKIIILLRKNVTALNGILDGILDGIAKYESELESLKTTEGDLRALIQELSAENGIKINLNSIHNVADGKFDAQSDAIIQELDYLIKDASQQLADIRKYLSKWPKKAKKIRKDLKASKDSLYEIGDITEELLNRVDARSHAFKEDIRPEGDSIFDELDDTRDDFKDDFDEINTNLKRLTDQLSLIRATVHDARDEIKDRLEGKSRYVDVSELAVPSEADGQLIYCNNYGEVSAKSLCGGIIGSIGIDDTKDTAFEIFDKFKYSYGDDDDNEEDDDEEEKESVTKHVMALVFACKNIADVYGESGYCGGICGRADYGLISSCSNFSDISSDDGKYVGGIAGRSNKIVESCYEMGGIAAKAYAGGVCGKAKDLYGNIVCSYLDMPTQEYVKAAGAVAGTATGSVSSNTFVDNGVGAVDNVTKYQEARGMSYDAMVNALKLPEEFYKFTVKFMDGENIVYSEQFEYGDEFKTENYPKITQIDGEYARWEEKEISPIKRNITVHCVRRVFVPAVSAKEDGKIKLVFAGEFYPDTSMTVRRANDSEWAIIETAKSVILPDIHYIYTDVYRYEIEQSEQIPEIVEIRAAKGSLPANAVLLLDENCDPISGVIDADEVDSFISCKGSIRNVGFVVVIEHVSGMTVIIIVVILIIALILMGFIAVVFVKWRKKRKNKKNEEGQEEQVEK